MSGVIQEANMMFAELEHDPAFRDAMAELQTHIGRYLNLTAGDDSKERAQCVADALADVYWRLSSQR